MKFENNFVRFNSQIEAPESNNEEIKREEEELIDEEEVKRADSGAAEPFSEENIDLNDIKKSIYFEEENLSDMVALSYLVQDSDQYIKMLLSVMMTNS